MLSLSGQITAFKKNCDTLELFVGRQTRYLACRNLLPLLFVSVLHYLLMFLPLILFMYPVVLVVATLSKRMIIIIVVDEFI